jgi:hypothetical protein
MRLKARPSINLSFSDTAAIGDELPSLSSMVDGTNVKHYGRLDVSF